MTRPSTLTSTLRTLADLSEIRGAGAAAADLRRAAAAIDALGPAGAARFEQRARRDRLDADEAGVSPTIHWRLRELALGGADVALRAAQAGLPFLLQRFLQLPVVSPAEALMLVRQLGIATLADLEIALDDGRVKQTAGEALEARLRQGADVVTVDMRPMTLGRALDQLDSLIPLIGECCPQIDGLTAAGDVRRFESLVSGLVLVGRSPDPAAAIGGLCGMAGVDDVKHRSTRRAVLSVQHTEVDVRIAAADEYGTVLFTATGSRAHLAGVHRLRGRPRLAAREADVYAQAGLPFIVPEMRQGSGEIEAAVAGTLPSLVSREHMRGDLHMHSDYSDGRDTLDVMIAECCRLGYEYIAITDHSERAGASRTLSRDQVVRQAEEIAVLRERYPRIAILHGIETDIMPDGKLDFPDNILEPLDIVLASLHDDAGHSPERLTRRCVQAIRHPLVTIITHPANRLVGRRAGYALDFHAVYAAAAETGTALEIDGAPSHLDLDGEHARAAVAAGVTVTIDSDCHRAASLGRQMHLGIGLARRGWVEPRHVLNTRPVEEVRAFVAAKRTWRR